MLGCLAFRSSLAHMYCSARLSRLRLESWAPSLGLAYLLYLQPTGHGALTRTLTLAGDKKILKPKPRFLAIAK